MFGEDALRIVCLTSNGYVNCVTPFAHYFNRFGGEDQRVIAAVYDLAPASLPDNFEIVSIGCQDDFTWSAGLIHLLDMLADDITLLMFEDYFLTAPVEWWRIERLARLMDKEPSIVKIDLSNDRLKVPYTLTACHDGIELVWSAFDAPYQLSMQAALWRTDVLRHFLDPVEDAWQAEKNGTKRIVAERTAGAFQGVILGCREPPMTYANAVGGEGHKPGVIEAKHMPGWMADECRAKGWMT